MAEKDNFKVFQGRNNKKSVFLVKNRNNGTKYRIKAVFFVKNRHDGQSIKSKLPSAIIMAKT